MQAEESTVEWWLFFKFKYIVNAKFDLNDRSFQSFERTWFRNHSGRGLEIKHRCRM